MTSDVAPSYHAAASPPMSNAAPGPHVSGSALRSLGQLMAHQMITRMATFALNVTVARHIGPVSYGISAVQLYLLNTVILFTSREAIRKSTLRYAAPASIGGSRARACYERSVILNLAWMAVAAAVPLCFIVRALFIAVAPSFEQASTAGSNDGASVRASMLAAEYARCLTLYTLASWLELLSEPLYVLCQKQQKVRTRVFIDGAAVLARCIVTFLSLLIASRSHGGGGGGTDGGGLLAFAYGQMAYAAVVVLGFYGHYIADMHRSRRSGSHTDSDGPLVSRLSDLLPQRLPALPSLSPSSSAPGLLSAWVDPSLLRLNREVLFQSCEKLALQEGEKFVLVSLHTANLDSQGVYGLIQNLGSLVARMLFQPLEEAAFMEFSLLFAHITSGREKEEMAAATAAAAKAKDGAKRIAQERAPTDESVDAPSSADLLASYTSGASQLGVLLHVVLLVGLVLLCFGPAYSYVFLDLLYGAKWSLTSAPSMLSLYCLYVLFMALNGVTEAFVQATISTRQLRGYNFWLLLCSALYLLACALAMRFGTAGLIAANCVNMSLRIAYSLWFIRRFFGTQAVAQAARSQEAEADRARAGDLLRNLRALSLPSGATCCALLSSLLLTQLSFHVCGIAHSHSLLRFGAHIAVGAACLSVVVAAVWTSERAFVQQVRRLVDTRKRKAA